MPSALTRRGSPAGTTATRHGMRVILAAADRTVGDGPTRSSNLRFIIFFENPGPRDADRYLVLISVRVACDGWGVPGRLALEHKRRSCQASVRAVAHWHGLERDQHPREAARLGCTEGLLRPITALS